MRRKILVTVLLLLLASQFFGVFQILPIANATFDTLLTYNSKYVITSTTPINFTSTTLANDTQASQQFTLSASQTVLAFYEANNRFMNGSAMATSGMKNAINVDGTDYALSYASTKTTNYPARNAIFWVGTLAAGSHWITGRAGKVSGTSNMTVNNRVLLIYILNGNEYKYVDDSTTFLCMNSTTVTPDTATSQTFTPSGSCVALYLYAATDNNTYPDIYPANGKVIYINVSGTNYGEAMQSMGTPNVWDSEFTAYSNTLTAVSTTAVGMVGESYSGSYNVSVTEREFAVLLFASSTLQNIVTSTTGVTTTSNTMVNDTEATITRTTTETRELLSFAMGDRANVASNNIGDCYGIAVNNVDYVNASASGNSASGVYGSSEGTAWAGTISAGTNYVQGRLSNCNGTETARVTNRILIALWLLPVTTQSVTYSGEVDSTGSLNDKTNSSALIGGNTPSSAGINQHEAWSFSLNDLLTTSLVLNSGGSSNAWSLFSLVYATVSSVIGNLFPSLTLNHQISSSATMTAGPSFQLPLLGVLPSTSTLASRAVWALSPSNIISAITDIGSGSSSTFSPYNLISSTTSIHSSTTASFVLSGLVPSTSTLRSLVAFALSPSGIVSTVSHVGSGNSGTFSLSNLILSSIGIDSSATNAFTLSGLLPSASTFKSASLWVLVPQGIIAILSNINSGSTGSFSLSNRISSSVGINSNLANALRISNLISSTSGVHSNLGWAWNLNSIISSTNILNGLIFRSLDLYSSISSISSLSSGGNTYLFSPPGGIPSIINLNGRGVSWSLHLSDVITSVFSIKNLSTWFFSLASRITSIARINIFGSYVNLNFIQPPPTPIPPPPPPPTPTPAPVIVIPAMQLDIVPLSTDLDYFWWQMSVPAQVMVINKGLVATDVTVDWKLQDTANNTVATGTFTIFVSGLDKKQVDIMVPAKQGTFTLDVQSTQPVVAVATQSLNISPIFILGNTIEFFIMIIFIFILIGLIVRRRRRD